MSKALVTAQSLYPTVSLAKRLTQVVSYGFAGGFFSPQTPIQPMAQQSEGRAFDYLAGYNLATKPRRDTGIDFQELRNFAQYYDLLRLVIETRKDQIVGMDWKIMPTNFEPGEKMSDDIKAECSKLENFFSMPDGRLSWHAWLRKVLEDSFVLDANVFWPVYEGKKLLRIEMIDPVTIQKFIDESGRTPEAPLPAYRQVLHGVPASEYTKEELLYFIKNERSNSVYGFGPVEQILMTINIGLRREVSQLQYFTEGNIPEAIAGVPDTWTPQQVQHFQTAWDSMFEGNLGARRHMKFVPGDASKVQMLKGSEALLKNEFDEWIVRIVCYAFSVSPQPFIKAMNRATAETAQAEARSEGLQPMLDYLKDMFDLLIRQCLGVQGYEFMWNMEEDQDPDTQSQIDDRYVKNGVWSIDEVRKRQGLEAVGVGNMIWTPKGPIPVEMFVDGSAVQLLTAGGGGGFGGNGNEESDNKDSTNLTTDDGKEVSGKPTQKFRKGSKAYTFRKSHFATAQRRKEAHSRSLAEGRY